MIVAIQSSMTLLPRLVQGDRRSWEAVASSLPVASLLKDQAESRMGGRLDVKSRHPLHQQCFMMSNAS